MSCTIGVGTIDKWWLRISRFEFLFSGYEVGTEGSGELNIGLFDRGLVDCI